MNEPKEQVVSLVTKQWYQCPECKAVTFNPLCAGCCAVGETVGWIVSVGLN